MFARPELSAPWAFTMADDKAAFHIVTLTCTLTLGGETVALTEGNFVVLPRGRSHVLSDAPARIPVKLDGSLKTRGAMRTASSARAAAAP